MEQGFERFYEVTEMSVILTKKHNGYTANVEIYESVMDVVRDCKTRKITDSRFEDMQKNNLDYKFYGVHTYDEALQLMNDGWNEKVKALQATVKKCKTIERKRIAFENAIQGFAPIVPLAILGVPNAMINTVIKPIKSKVISIYYNMGVSAYNSTETIVENGRKVVEAVVRLENSGYRVNLYALQAYAEDKDCDILAIKVKSANQPLDLKRICFPIMHSAMFRVIGFDWENKFPKGKYRIGRGRPLSSAIGEERAQGLVREIFGKESVYLMATEVQKSEASYIEEMLKGGKK